MKQPGVCCTTHSTSSISHVVQTVCASSPPSSPPSISPLMSTKRILTRSSLFLSSPFPSPPLSFFYLSLSDSDQVIAAEKVSDLYEGMWKFIGIEKPNLLYGLKSKEAEKEENTLIKCKRCDYHIEYPKTSSSLFPPPPLPLPPPSIVPPHIFFGDFFFDVSDQIPIRVWFV